MSGGDTGDRGENGDGIEDNDDDDGDDVDNMTEAPITLSVTTACKCSFSLFP